MKNRPAQYIETVLRYILATAEHMTAEDLKQVVEDKLAPDQGAMIMTIAEQLKQEGLQQGIQKGVREGLLEGIELAIHLRFGASGAHLLSDISHIQEVSALRRIKEALMTAKTPDDIKALIEH